MKLLKISLSIIIILVNYSFAETIKIACIGDSITFGAGIKDRKNMNYPIQLGKILGEKYEIKNFGNSGSTMLKKGDKPYWKQREFKSALEFNPNIVVIKLGTNDTKPQNWKHGADYLDDYKSMISIFSNLTSKPKIYICLPVPVVESRWGITDDIVNEKIIPTLRKISNQTKCKIIDLNTPFSNKHNLIPDKIHPNAKGATIIAKEVAKSILNS